MRATCVVIALFAAVFVLPADGQAQVDPDSIHHRNECRLAAQVLSTGHPAPKSEWATYYIGFCDPALHARALALAIKRFRTSTDTAALALHWGGVGFLHDSELFDAVVAVAADRSASVLARLWALRTLAQYLDPEGFYTVESIATTRCSTHRSLPGHYSVRVLSALPTNWRERARNLGTTATNAPEPEIRAAGECVRSNPAVWGRVGDSPAPRSNEQ